MNNLAMKSSFEQPSLVVLESLDGPVLLVREHEHHGMEAVLGLDLAAVMTIPGRDGEGCGMHLMENLGDAMRPGWWLELVYSYHANVFQWRVFAGALGADTGEAIENARSFYSEFQMVARTDTRLFTFHPVQHAKAFERGSGEFMHRKRIRPVCMDIDAHTHPMGFSVAKNDIMPGRARLRLPLMAGMSNGGANHIGQVLGQCGSAVEVRHRYTRVSMRPEAAKALEIALKWFQNGKEKRIGIHNDLDASVTNDKILDMACRQLALWLHSKSGLRMDTSILSAAPISPVLAAAIGRQFCMGTADDEAPEANGAEITITEDGCLDLRDCLPLGHALPSTLPDPADLQRAGTARTYNFLLPRLQEKGTLLGEASDGVRRVPVRFHADDRSRHCYILGATGTGKSTLLANMIAQDMENGEGLTVIDPHGDLYRQILISLPPHRYNDLVIVNPTDSKWAVGMNFLECSGQDRSLQVHYIVNELMKIFQRLYMREHMGPVFEMFMRTALLLLLEQPEDQPHTLLDVPRLFEDKEFRNGLKRTCTNPMAVRFWDKTGEHCSGDWSLPNMSAYISSKLNQFVYNGRVRSIIGQPVSSINFREILDERKILLINLGKGQLGQLDSQFLGMLILGKIFGAALSRATQQASRRIPHYLYIDEFQNFTTDTVAHMMSEARKFELRLVLANQNLGQLESNQHGYGAGVLEAVLGNAASMLTFRTGVTDAEKVKAYMEPEYSAQDLQYLPDFHVAAKLLVRNIPAHPFVFQTLPFEGRKVARGVHSAVQRACKRYSKSLTAVNAEILKGMGLTQTDPLLPGLS